MSGNGKSNGGNGKKPVASESGGNGGSPVAISSVLTFEALNMLMRQIRAACEDGRDLPADEQGWAEKTARELQQHPNPRVRNAGGKLDALLRSYKLRALELADKMARLDAGSPTEIVDAPMVVKFDRRG